MFLIVILIIVVLIVFAIYKLCVYLNNNVKTKKINNIILKVCLSGLFVIFLMLLYYGIDGYLNGSEGFFCGSIAIGDCFDYGLNGFFQNIFRKCYWCIPILFIFLLYIIIYKLKYKGKIIVNKLLYFIIMIIVALISFLPLYKKIFNKFYFNFIDYKYEIIVKDFDYNDYYIHIYDKKINVIKKEQVICFDISCDPIYNGEYQIIFSDSSMIEIYKYVDNLFIDKNFTSKTIFFDNIKDINEQNIVKSIISNDEIYIKDTNN